MEDYQQKRMKEYLLPETVYRQALWAARDLPRLKEKLEEAKENQDALPSSDPARQPCSGSDSITERRGQKISSLTMRIEAIESALYSVPEKYRKGLSEKLFYRKAFNDDFNPNTWKKWQQICIYNIARNLDLL